MTNYPFDFSIQIPSRGRVKPLCGLLQQLEDFTVNKDKVEIIIALDDDDTELFNYIEMIEKFKSFDKKILIRQRSWKLINDYCNLMAQITRGKVLWGLNDDSDLGTNKWDVIAKKIIEDSPYKDPLKYVFALKVGGTGVGEGGYSAFPMISRAAYKCLGYYFYPELYTFDGDEVLHNYFSPIKRLISAMGILIIHRAGSDKIEDETHQHMREGYNKGIITGKDFRYYKEIVNKLKDCITREPEDV